MTASLDITQNNAFAALGAFLTNILPSGIPIFQAQTNRVPEPANSDFVVMTPLFRERLEWNVTTYSDGFPVAGPQIRKDLVPTKFTVQLDVHGPNGGDNVQIITTLFRSSYGVDTFSTYGFDVTPLYSSDPAQIPFLNGEQQIENRWSVDVYLQVNAATTVTQDFADHLNVTVISVEKTYPLN